MDDPVTRRRFGLARTFSLNASRIMTSQFLSVLCSWFCKRLNALWRCSAVSAQTPSVSQVKVLFAHSEVCYVISCNILNFFLIPALPTLLGKMPNGVFPLCHDLRPPSFVRRPSQVSGSFISRTVWPRIIKMDTDFHTDLLYSFTRCYFTSWFLSAAECN